MDSYKGNPILNWIKTFEKRTNDRLAQERCSALLHTH